MKNSHKAYGFGLGAVLLWSTVATAFKLALAHYSPLELLLVASVSSILALGIILICQGKLALLGRQLRSSPFLYLQTGLLNPFLYYLVLFKAYELLPAQQALSLNYTWAVLLPLLSVPLLGQRLRKSDLSAALLAYVGVFIIACGGKPMAMEFAAPEGVALALLSTLLWCLYWIINTKDQGDPVVSLMLSFLLGLPFILLGLAYQGTVPSLALDALLPGVYVGLFEMGVTFVLWLLALKNAERTASISTLVFLSPVLSMGVITLVLGEPIAPATVLGLGLILLALAMQQLWPKVKARFSPKPMAEQI
ncbi:DMT family transporter [Shewanella cyperi]|uniref:DMT family transporter n=1 Tax=Shewanella cyperi TaxID=2814292 RepID=UPI001A93E3B8|nr:DMT family transporter [Shewanella cyperi]QSX39866.1 DMT family transporter [Shewanella cyperi]